MKKVLGLLLIVFVCAGVIGCSGSSESEKDKQIAELQAENEKLKEQAEKLPDETSIETPQITAIPEETENVYETRTPEEEADFEKEREESLIEYSDMIEEIQADLPEMQINGVNSEDDGTKTLSIRMDLLESKDATLYKIAELTTNKETLMNNNEITDIIISVYNQGEISGMVIFHNDYGEYNPTVNTL